MLKQWNIVTVPLILNSPKILFSYNITLDVNGKCFYHYIKNCYHVSSYQVDVIIKNKIINYRFKLHIVVTVQPCVFT